MNKKRKNRKGRWKQAAAALLLLAITVKDTYVVYAWEGWSWRASYINDNNDSEQLYEWVRLEDERTDISTLVKPSAQKNGVNYYRMLICSTRDEVTYYYQADPSRWVGYDPSTSGSEEHQYGKSMVTVSSTPQVKYGEKNFVTRGGLQAFYVEPTGTCTWTDSDYKGDYQYRLHPCKPGTDDIYSNVSLWWADGPGKVNDIWYYDEKGEPVGNDRSNEWWKRSDCAKSYYAEGSVYDKWTLSKVDYWDKGCQQFVFTAAHFGSFDPHIGIWDYQGVKALSGSSNYDWQQSHQRFSIYIGGPVGQKLSANSADQDITEVVAFTTPYILRKNQKYVVEKDGVMFINDTFVVRGELVNRGLIIVGNDGCIIDLDDETTTQRIRNEGGDIIVKKGGYISLDDLISEAKDGRCPQIVNYGNILAKSNLWLYDTVFENSGELFYGIKVYSSELVKKNVSQQRELDDQRARLLDNFRLSNSKQVINITGSCRMGDGNKVICSEGCWSNVPMFR